MLGLQCWILAVSVCTGMFFSCKKAQKKDSQAKNIDNVVSGDLPTANDPIRPCGPGSGSDISADAALQQAYKAVPELVRGYIPASTYRLAPLEEVQKTCNSVFAAAIAAGKNAQADLQNQLNEQAANVTACWRTKEDQHPEILVVNDPKIVHQRALAMAFYVFLEFYVDQAIPAAVQTAKKDGKDLDEKFLKGITEKRQQVTEKFLELFSKNADSKTVLENYGKRFATPAQELKSSLLFSNFVLAESLDSYYCSAATHSSFKRLNLDPLLEPLKKLSEDLGSVTDAGKEYRVGLGLPWYVSAP